MESKLRKWHLRAGVVAGALLIMFLAGATAVSAQTFRGTVLGTVTDQSGATVGAATVTVHNVDTGLERTTQTSDDGSYAVPELPLGTYKVTITKSGFQSFVANDVRVDVASQSRVDAALKAGNVATTVTVEGSELPQIETTSDTLGGTMTAPVMESLPLNGRDFTKLIFWNPGVAGSPDQITDSPGSFGVFSVNGARGRANNFLIDGTDMNDAYHNINALNQGGVFAVPSAILSIDALAELQVLSNFQAEYGRNSGGTIQFVTKSGTNDFHGTAQGYFRNNAFDARNFFNPVGQAQAPLHNSHFGGSVGGPIFKDKWFFYVNYEGQRETGGSVSIDNVPIGGTGPNGSLAPADASNPIIATLLGATVAGQRHAPLWPVANLPPTCAGSVTGAGISSIGCASVITPFFNNVNSTIAKMDYSINTNNTLTGRYFYSTSKQAFPLALSPTGGQLPGGNTVTPTIVHLVSLSLVSSISPTQTNEARLGWNRFFEAFLPEDMGFVPSTTGLCVAAVPNPCPSSPGPGNTGLPVISVTGLSKLGATSSDPRRRVDTNWQALDNFSWKIGRHDLKFGYEYRRTTIAANVNSSARGTLNFSPTVNAAGMVTATAIQNFLSGTLGTGNLVSEGIPVRNTVENSQGMFIEDSFRFSPRLTINAGLRWDYYGVISEKHNLASECVISAGPTCTLTQVGTGGLDSGLYNPDYTNFSPRLSVAYDVFGTSKTIVRAGIGSFYDSLYHSFFITNSVNNSSFARGPVFNPFGPAAATLDTSFAPMSAGCPAGVLTASCPIFAQVAAFTGDITTVDRNIRTPLMYNFNLNLEQQVVSKMVLQVGYVGSLGRHLLRFRDINQPSQAAITAADDACAPGGAGMPLTVACVNAGDPRAFATISPATGAFYINQDEATANSDYHALQVVLKVSNWHGLTSSANFAWSHSIDNASDGADFAPNGAQPNDSTRANLEKGNSNFDIRRRFGWNLVYQFPALKGSWSKLTDGWGVDSVVNMQDGQPFQLNYNFSGDFSGSGEFFDRPDVVGPIRINSHDPNNFLDLTSFAVPCTYVTGSVLPGAIANCAAGSRHFGNLGRNALRGPALKQLDFSIFKDTKLTERLNLQLRIEIFNLFNHPNFANPFLPSGLAAADFNGISTPASPCATVALGHSCGSLPITVTSDVGPGNPFLGGGPPRGIQFAAKFTF